MNATALLLAMSMIGQPAVPEPPSVPQEIPTVPAKEVPVVEEEAPQLPKKLGRTSLSDARARAKETGKRLVVFVGVDSSFMDDDDSVVVVELASGYLSDQGYPSQCVIVSDRGGQDHYKTLKMPMSQDDVRRAVRGGQPAADPFEQPQQRQQSARPDRRRAEGDSSSPWLSESEQQRIRKMWPASVSFPEGLKFYQRTVWGQRIANDATSNSDTIRPQHIDDDAYFGNSGPALNPNKHVSHWRTPGGLDQVTGWTSTLPRGCRTIRQYRIGKARSRSATLQAAV